MEITINLISIVIPILIAAFFMVKYAKKTIENTFINEENKLKMAVEVWLNSDKGKGVMFSVGALLSNGVKSGFGITKGKGKFSIESVIAEIAGSWAKKKFGLGSAEGQNTLEQPKETFKSEF